MGIREEELFKKAEKIDAKDYEGWVSWEDHGDREGYFESVEVLIDYCDENMVAKPAWVWACYETRLSITVSDVLELALSEHHEDAGDWISKDDRKELQELLDKWASKQNVITYHCDTSKAVILSQSPPGRSPSTT